MNRRKYVALVFALVLCATSYAITVTAASYSNNGNYNYIPILTYHNVFDGEVEKGDRITVSKKEFEKQIEYLHSNGYIPLFFSEFYDILANKKPIDEKYVVLSFDDGYVSNYDLAYPILKKYNMKANMGLVTSFIDGFAGQYKMLERWQIKELEESGVFRFANHSLHHDKQAGIPADELRRQIDVCDETLSNELNNFQNQKMFVYPYGEYDRSTKKIYEQKGYLMQFTSDPGVCDYKTQFYCIPRNTVVSGMTGESMMKEIEDHYGKQQKNNYEVEN